MNTDQQPRTIYYRAKNEAQIDNRPFFFGWVEIIEEKITGQHYKPKLNQLSGQHTIGFYKIEGDAADFLHTFETKGLVEITQEEFNAHLSQWTQGGEYAPDDWGSGISWEIVKSG